MGRESLISAVETLIEVDTWLDSGVGSQYTDQPLGQHWARVAKAGEEVGEAIEKLILWTGQNPRKPQNDAAYDEMLDEMADVAITALLGIQHFTKDADETVRIANERFAYLVARMRATPGYAEVMSV